MIGGKKSAAFRPAVSINDIYEIGTWQLKITFGARATEIEQIDKFLNQMVILCPKLDMAPRQIDRITSLILFSSQGHLMNRVPKYC